MGATGTGAICEGITKAGTRCRNPALPGERWCWFHHPAKAAARAAAGAKGGHARHGRHLSADYQAPVAIANLGDVVRVLNEELNAARTLEVSIARTRAITYVCATMATIYQKSELEARMAAIEAELGKRR